MPPLQIPQPILLMPTLIDKKWWDFGQFFNAQKYGRGNIEKKLDNDQFH
jgi:hypothetical protein